MEDALRTRVGQRAPHRVAIQQVELLTRRRDRPVAELRQEVLPDEPAPASHEGGTDAHDLTRLLLRHPAPPEQLEV